MNNLTIKANKCSEIVFLPTSGHLMCLTKQITQITLNIYFVREHPETVNDQGTFYTLVCRNKI